MKQKEKPYYIVEHVPSKYIDMSEIVKGFWYCHLIGHPNIPVIESIGSKKNADKICKMMNESIGYRN
jgi:hypothetical protein